MAGIQSLIDQKRIVEPLTSFYKDEVREIGREMGVPQKYLERHPFPGPGLAIRCLCSAKQASLMQVPEGWILPIRSVGVQGDSRSYHHALVVDHGPTQELIKLEAPALTNRLTDINRVVAACGSKAPLSSLKLFEAYTHEGPSRCFAPRGRDRPAISGIHADLKIRSGSFP